MNDRAAKNLRYIGLGVVLVSILLLWLPVLVPEGVEVAYSDAIASTLAIGIGLLLLSEIGPMVKSLKAGGIEVEFLDSVNDKFNVLEGRIAKLEIAAVQTGRPDPGPDSRAAEKRSPPGLAQEGKYRDDPQKGRFGGEAERDGFKLSASFRNVTRNFVEIVLRVEAPRRTDMQDWECVEFYLHDSFEPDVVPAVFREGVAELSLLAYGGFTVGAWVACTGVELELDLSKIKGAPRMIREN
jgi:hypothetical protein